MYYPTLRGGTGRAHHIGPLFFPQALRGIDVQSRSSRRPGSPRIHGSHVGLWIGGTLLPGAPWARMQERGEITSEMLVDAEAVAGLSFTEEERELMLEGLSRNRQAYLALRERAVPNEVLPTVQFDPVLPGIVHPRAGSASAEGSTARPLRDSL